MLLVRGKGRRSGSRLCEIGPHAVSFVAPDGGPRRVAPLDHAAAAVLGVLGVHGDVCRVSVYPAQALSVALFKEEGRGAVAQ